MAYKTIGRSYLVWPDEGYNRGHYYFGRYCPFCEKKVYLTTEDAQTFLNNASMWLRREGVFKILKRKISFSMPKVSVKIEWRRGLEPVDNLVDIGGLDTTFGYDKLKLAQPRVAQKYGK